MECDNKKKSKQWRQIYGYAHMCGQKCEAFAHMCRQKLEAFVHMCRKNLEKIREHKKRGTNIEYDFAKLNGAETSTQLQARDKLADVLDRIDEKINSNLLLKYSSIMYEFTSYYMRSNFSSDDGWRLANDFWFEALQKNKRVTPTVLIYFNKNNVKQVNSQSTCSLNRCILDSSDRHALLNITPPYTHTTPPCTCSHSIRSCITHIYFTCYEAYGYDAQLLTAYANTYTHTHTYTHTIKSIPWFGSGNSKRSTVSRGRRTRGYRHCYYLCWPTSPPRTGIREAVGPVNFHRTVVNQPRETRHTNRDHRGGAANRRRNLSFQGFPCQDWRQVT